MIKSFSSAKGCTAAICWTVSRRNPYGEGANLSPSHLEGMMLSAAVRASKNSTSCSLPSGSWESNREERLHSGDYDKSDPNGRAMPSWDSLPFGISGKDLQEGLPEFMLEAKLGFNRER